MKSFIKRVSFAGPAATTVASLALLLFASTSAMAAIVVDQNAAIGAPSCTGALTQYNTIQSAVSAAPSGATIQVCPGSYAEQVTIAAPLTLKGVTGTNTGAAVVVVPGTYTSGQLTQIDIRSSGVTLTNIGVDGANTLSSCDFGPTITGILFDTNSSGSLKDVALRNHNISNGSGGYCNSGTAVSSSSGSSVTITDSTVRNFDSVGISLTTTSSVTVKTTTVAPVYVPSPLTSNIPNCIYANAPTVQVSSNTVSGCTSGVYVTTTVSGTVSNNTITGFGTFETGYGFICFPTCTGITVSGNQIFNTAVGATMKTSGETGSINFENNTINGTGTAVYLFLQPNNTVSNNTITDANVGVYGVTGNTVTGNTYRTVTTLTQP